jgi:hypothetical protein
LLHDCGAAVLLVFRQPVCMNWPFRRKNNDLL